MGVVYKGRDPAIDRPIAIKTLLPREDLPEASREEFRRRFEREARAAGGLNHPGIVVIHDVGRHQDSGELFLAMEYVEGESLEARLKRSGRLEPQSVADLGHQLATALAYAHARACR